jgi:hypothetical protein
MAASQRVEKRIVRRYLPRGSSPDRASILERAADFATATAAAVLTLVLGCSAAGPSGDGSGDGDSDLNLPPVSPSGFLERWESSDLDVFSPETSETFGGDAGDWFLGDTVSNSDDCGPSPHRVEVITHLGSQAIRLTSAESNSSCADNIWIVFFTDSVVRNGVEIPLSPSTHLSFYAEPQLEELGPSPCGWYPCEITVEVEDTFGNIVVYVLQRSMGKDRVEPFYIVRIPLDSDAGHYERNLYDDFRLIPTFIPTGARIRDVSLNMDHHGSVVLDDVMIADRSDPGVEKRVSGADDTYPVNGARRRGD